MSESQKLKNFFDKTLNEIHFSTKRKSHNLRKI